MEIRTDFPYNILLKEHIPLYINISGQLKTYALKFGDSEFLVNGNYTASDNQFFNSTIDVTGEANIYGCVFNSVNLKSTGLINLNDLRIDSNSNIFVNDTTRLQNITGTGTLVIKPGNQSYDKKIVPVILKNMDLNQLKFSDFSINLLVDTKQDTINQIKLYQQLAQHFNDIPNEKKKYDIPSIKLTNHLNHDAWKSLLREKWDGFGYDKNLIILNSLILTLLFFSFNWLVFPNIMDHGYHIQEFTDEEKERLNRLNIFTREFHYFIYCIFFTIFVFWGLKLKIDQLKITHKFFTMYILIQYTVGIVCLAHIANIIIIN